MVFHLIPFYISISALSLTSTVSTETFNVVSGGHSSTAVIMIHDPVMYAPTVPHRYHGGTQAVLYLFDPFDHFVLVTAFLAI